MIITYVMLGKTNAAAYELYGFFGEANGWSLPLGFIFTAMTDGSATEHAEQRMLAESLTWLVKCCPNIVFTQTKTHPKSMLADRKFPESSISYVIITQLHISRRDSPRTNHLLHMIHKRQTKVLALLIPCGHEELLMAK